MTVPTNPAPRDPGSPPDPQGMDPAVVLVLALAFAAVAGSKLDVPSAVTVVAAVLNALGHRRE